ncbi:glycoside hydrolase family 11 protein [Fibrobacter succinogenes]|uniref:endo-1,4-beta-xylanase n=2 Tax=Fibrobacter succinogenes TaxID=833 RepID=A0A380RUH6_FIBSU|nr:glycoside hydrolase family 11 protein [Fibrobacter succinogenes]PWJ36702.1 glycosyl hydrolase family 11 [Fibrobacter succinogenes subsp. elongatus]SUQ18951.1 Glycosyl hydrolases family 11 [Fibrobacter succinogenes]
MKTFSATKSGVVLAMALGMASTAFAQDFCSNAQHSGQKVTITSNQTGKIGDIGYELWDENGHGGSATFYSDGSMDCNITGAKDYLCRAGLSLGSNKTYKELGGDMIAEFKLVKSGAQNVGYSYIGIYGWMEGVSGTPSQLVEYYVIDNTLANDMPGSWIGNERKGTITVDGGTYTVYRNTRTGPAIKNSGNVTFYQYFSVRTSPRDCGTINISEHMRQWEKMGMTMGKLYEAKVLGEAGNVNGEVRGGHMDFPHAKVYVKNGSDPVSSSSVKSSSSTDAPKSSSSKGNGNVSGKIDACKDVMGHEGKETRTQGQNNSSVTGNVGSSPYHYEIWYQGGNNSMTFYDNGTYKASWNGTNDFLARVGFKYDEKHTYEELGPIDAYYKWSKQGSAGGYNYIGIYGWTVDPLVEYYIVDDWFNKPGANLLGQRKGEFTVDGDTYEIWQNTRVQQPSIKGTQTFPQYFSVRKSARSCGHIDITAHMKKWEELGMKMGKMYEAKVLVEAGGGSGSFDVTYFKMTDKAHPLPQPEPESSSSEAKVESSSSQTIGLIAAPKMELKSGNFQVFDMQGRFLGTVKLDAGASVAQVLKANFKNAGIYMVKQGNFMQRVAVK